MARNTPVSQEIIYSDFRTDFAANPVSLDLAPLTNEEAVKRSIRNICLTSAYERPWNPTFGAGLADYLFEPITMVTEQNIKRAIEQAIANYEPRAQTFEVYVTARPDLNAYSATIVFSVINSPTQTTFSFLLDRVR